MELNYLHEFVTLVENRKFFEAAEQLFISQPTLSKHMKALEQELGVPLFERKTKRKVQLTKYGEKFFPYAEQIMILYREYLEIQSKQQREFSTTLNIGSIPAMKQYRITDMLAKFRVESPDVIMNVEELESDDSRQKILSGELDFAFVREYTNAGEDRLSRIRYTSDKLVVILPANHRLANRKSVSLIELSSEQFMFLKGTTFMYEMCVSECVRAGFEPKIIYTGTRGDNIVNMVSRGDGVALLTKTPISDLQDANVRFVDIRPSITTNINLIYNSQMPFSREANHFLEFVCREIAAHRENPDALE